MNESVVFSNKVPFALLTSESFPLLSHKLYTRTSLTDPTWKIIYTWEKNSFGFPTTTEMRSNLHNFTVPYISKSIMLEMTNPNTKGAFSITNDGHQVIYTPMNPQSSVEVDFWYGYAVNVTLKIGNLASAPDQRPPELHEEHGIQYLLSGGEVNGATFSKGKKSVVVPDSTYFSFITNTSMYFSTVDNPKAAIHQVILDKLVEVKDRTLQGFASAGGRYALTSNKDKLYPDGISTLCIDDGFSESMATIEFNHDASEGTVEISVKSHTARTCELSESTIVFIL
ncbi:hypothetical protein PS914_01832 [Pseudomonas fluorescens]|uniref:Uncharacterized protein n=2 Tax=Pseudomonas fluorescens TaxID=294 RepID=A0A5E7RRF8_PSEFL|nr:hypothetical protein PS833_05603 [Pseudomonas fluorescens]VVP77052.1 hypothetical protein PS914_01832 [Pseudomonas fluorescens]